MIRYLIPLALLCFACSDDDMESSVDPSPIMGEPQVISDLTSCDSSVNSRFICEILEIEEPHTIDPFAYEWSPEIRDLNPGDQLVFKNQGEETYFKVVESGNYSAKERISIACNENYERNTYICQENEIVYASFLNDLLGVDTLRLELRTIVSSYQDQTPGEKGNLINFFQMRNNSLIANFWFSHVIGDDYYERTLQSFNKEIVLNGEVYTDVVKYEYGEHIRAEPDFRYYIQKGKGILGFEVDGRLWLRD